MEKTLWCLSKLFSKCINNSDVFYWVRLFTNQMVQLSESSFYDVVSALTVLISALTVLIAALIILFRITSCQMCMLNVIAWPCFKPIIFTKYALLLIPCRFDVTRWRVWIKIHFREKSKLQVNCYYTFMFEKRLDWS